MPYGTGTSADLAITQCIVRGLNEIWVTLNEFSGLLSGSQDSELNPSNWRLVALSAQAFPRLVQSVEQVKTREDAAEAGAPELFDFGFSPALRIFSDGPLSPLERYRLRFVADDASAECEIDGAAASRVAFEKTATQDDGSIDDYKNPQFDRDKLPLGALGTFNLTDEGDLSIEGRSASLRKRMVRRITSAVGSFYHMPNYGTDLESKAVITPDLGRRIRERVTNGIRQEPDVLAAETRVYLVVGQEGMVVISATAATVFGETVTASKEVDLGG
jgi:hypothetical protein